MVKVIAHRGYSSKYLENTIPSFQAAYDYGVWGIELDVQLSRDGQVMIYHDEKLTRLAKRPGRVKDYSLAELQQMILAKDQVTGKIPSLREYLFWVQDKDIVTNIEIKRNRYIADGIEQQVIHLVQAFNLADAVIISSFSSQSLARVKKINSIVQIAYLFNKLTAKTIKQLDHLQVDFIHPKHNLLTNKNLKQLTAQGHKINAYTVNESADISRMKDLQIHGIITDYPERIF